MTSIRRRIPRPPLKPGARGWLNRGGRGQPRRSGRSGPLDWENLPQLPRLGPVRERTISPPRPPFRGNPVPMPFGRGNPMRPGPSPEQVGEDFVGPDMEEFSPLMPPMRPDRREPQRPRWEGQMPAGGVGGEEPQFSMSNDIMDALMELLMRRSAPGGRAA